MPDIRQQVLIAAPAPVVFDALTTKEGLSAWWTPDAAAVPEINSTARFPFGPVYVKEMQITQLIMPVRVEWYCIAGAGEWLDTTLSFGLHSGTADEFSVSNPEILDQIQQLSPFDRATIVHLQHNNWKDYTPMFAECTYTWGQFLRSLKIYCQAGEGTPWPHQHQL